MSDREFALFSLIFSVVAVTLATVNIIRIHREINREKKKR